MVTSEANPLAKTGGLADVVYSLSKELVRRNDVSIFMPFYRSIEDKVKECKLIKECIVYMSWRKVYTKLYLTFINGIKYYLIKCDQYFSRASLYGYDDDNERFAYFTIAVKQLMGDLNMKADIIHIHDWQPGMLPVLIRDDKNNPLNKAKFILTIHNPAFKGYFNPYQLGDLYGMSDEHYIDGSIRFKDNVSTLKSAIVYANKITTVSPTHRSELLYQDISDGLNHVLEYRKDDFIGVLNGIDYNEFDPKYDEKIYEKYVLRNIKSKKAVNKKSLEEELHLKVDDAPLYGMVSRLTWQKGFDILLPAIHGILARGSKVVILGSGEYNYEQALENLRREFPDNLAIYIGYNDELAHKIYAASDFLLMPSLFEPCGLSQMIAHRYGTLPVVRRVGGLRDSVISYDGYNLETANGFGFDDYSEGAIWGTLEWCEENYRNKYVMRKLIKNAMHVKHDWKSSTRQYLKIYR